MKTKLLFINLLLIALQACNFLEEDPKNFISPGNFYKNPADAIAAVNAVYDPLNEISASARELYLMAELSTDNMDLNGRNQERVQIDEYLTVPNNSIILNMWETNYRGINRANAVIGRVPAIAMDPALRDRILGEARFLRAYYYFNLVRFFGDVPLVTTETNSLKGLNVARNPAEAVYQTIVEDLLAAEPLLPLSYSGADVGRATQGAAKALLAKVYLTRGEWQAAAAKAREVIDSKAYILLDNYADNFAVALKNGKEAIFECQAIANFGFNDSGNAPTNFGPMPQNQFGHRAYGGFWPTFEILAAYEPGDSRARLYLDSLNGKPLSRPHINKYIDPTGNENNNNNNWPLLRYADVILMYAEAVNEGGNVQEAAAYLNQIRSRAKLPATTAVTQTGLREAIEKERRLELAFEGHRWFDLVRTGKLIETMRAKGKTGIQGFHVLYPIPQREMDTNPSLTQNEGY
jgi:starch-binding outer membrane protein, SusD/RagB family